MTALVFVDTNVLVQARDSRDPVKHSLAAEWVRLLWNQERGRTSVQVLDEYYDLVTRKLGERVKRDDAWEDVQFYLTWNPQPVDIEVLACAHDIERRHSLPWRDSVVVASAQVQSCVLLLSDTLDDGAEYAGVIVRSPFTLKIADESAAYRVPPRMLNRHRGRGRPRGKSSRAAAGGS